MSAIPGKKMHLNAFLMASGHHESGWRLGGANPRGVTDIEHWKDLAQIAEEGKLDSVFLADQLYIGWGARYMPSIGAIDPTLILAVMAACTKRIGLIGTMSTSFSEPYALARTFATLDHLSSGRAAWNAITSTRDEEAKNFGADALARHEERYERGFEFVEVVQKLWDSWEDGAYVADVDSGHWANMDGIHPVEHEGKHFRVAGALPTPRSPQGRPVIFEAGSSKPGMELAARSADAVFTAQTTLERATAFRRMLSDYIADAGREAEDVVLLPGLMPIIGESEEKAKQLESDLMTATSEGQILNYLSMTFEHDFEEGDLETPFHQIEFQEIKGQKDRPKLLREMAIREGLSVRELGQRAVFARGHAVCVGTPDQIADEMELWFRKGVCDGFNIMPPILPEGLSKFVDLVVPILQQRGLFRREYEGETLREHLGLGRPASRFAGE